MSTFSERLFLNCADLLGMRLFKKYWPVGGSIWNRRHTDPTNVNDLEKIIDDSWEYTRVHVLTSIFLGNTMVLSYVQGTFDWKIFAIPIGLELYAFSAHIYNRIKARHVLQQLKDKEPETKIDVPIYTLPEPDDIDQLLETANSNEMLHIRCDRGDETHNIPNVYYVILKDHRFSFKRLSPFFDLFNHAVEFRTELYSKYGKDFMQYKNIPTN